MLFRQRSDGVHQTVRFSLHVGVPRRHGLPFPYGAIDVVTMNDWLVVERSGM